MQTPRIIDMEPKRLIGFSETMSFANDQTGKLWGQFMPRRNEIENPISTNKYALQQFGPGFDWYQMDVHAEFMKWAAMEGDERTVVPEGMSALNVPGGRYAVFMHRGISSQFPATLRSILHEWMPDSGYIPDISRPQFEVLDHLYIHNDPASQEEIWFPIKSKVSTA